MLLQDCFDIKKTHKLQASIKNLLIYKIRESILGDTELKKISNSFNANYERNINKYKICSKKRRP